jgi:transposase-like protein
MLDKVRNKDKAWVKKRLDDIFLAPDAADQLETSGEDALTCLNFPDQHRRRIRTTNSLESFNQEIKRRISVLRILPNRNSALSLIRALCMKQAKEWITGRQYLDMLLLEKTKENKIINQPTIIIKVAGRETVTF